MMNDANAHEIEFRSDPARAIPPNARARFELDCDCPTPDSEPMDCGSDKFLDASEGQVDESKKAALAPGRHSQNAEERPSNSQSGAWRQEVAARINRYRSRRRPRQARYPSLLLKFEENTSAAESADRTSSRDWDPTPSADPTERTIAVDQSLPENGEVSSEPLFAPAPLSVETARILEFPRPILAPPRPLDELASPVIDRPRIIEVPETPPPAPALGGISIETEQEREEKRPGFEIPLQAAPLALRLEAAALDLGLILLSIAGFAGIFFRMTHTIPAVRDAAWWGGGLLVLLWSAYQYAFWVYSGATPGTWVAKLQLSHFDGSAVPRETRRWRAVASILSAASLGLGLAWCFLDEDQLCWHDRITRTYIAPGPGRRSA
jgi:uncharacterized RDD family membrane protein YckC